MPNNIDLKLLGVCPEMAEATKEALAVKTHFESITPMRELPRVLERVHKTEIRLTTGEVLAIAACICKLAGETEEQRLKFLNFFKGLRANAEKYRVITAKVSLTLIDEMIGQLEEADLNRKERG